MWWNEFDTIWYKGIGCNGRVNVIFITFTPIFYQDSETTGLP